MRPLSGLLAPWLLLLAGCSGGGAAPAPPPAPAFALLDVNPTSSTFDQQVSPRDFISDVSGYYFGEAT